MSEEHILHPTSFSSGHHIALKGHGHSERHMYTVSVFFFGEVVPGWEYNSGTDFFQHAVGLSSVVLKPFPKNREKQTWPIFPSEHLTQCSQRLQLECLTGTDACASVIFPD